ncbi:Cof-type HAD-IIB family hydrolase [Dehalogenimonas etheniformans]|nr:Cof-type HAD-IIB family hydrolase [Dehalogenimonas etheniformans]
MTKGRHLKNIYELIVIDLDGTIVDAHGNISNADKIAIAEARTLGIRVALSTGRVVDACRKYITELGLDGVHIFFDGALVYDPSLKDMIYSQPIKTETLKEAIAFARQNRIYIELYAIDRYFVEEINWADKIHREFFGLHSTLANFDDIAGKETIIKCELMVHNDAEEAKYQRFIEHFKDKLRGSIARTPAYPDVRFVNVVDPRVSKGSALEKLAEHLDIDLDRVMAIGDGTNDLSLLEKAGLKIAMGNARDELKSIADHVTLPVDKSGVAAAINKFILEGETGRGKPRPYDGMDGGHMKFRIVVEKDPETNEFSAYCPELPGCNSCGMTEEDAVANATEAIKLYLEPSEIGKECTGKVCEVEVNLD